jgi:putative membrane protein
MKTLNVLIFIIVSAVLASCGRSANQKAIHTMNDKTMVMTNTGKDNDAEFLKAAVNGGMMEVELGNLAQQNAQHPRVKNYGAMMVRDHSKANEDLKTLATSKNIAIPEGMEDMDKMNDMKKKTGADFDKDYIGDMVDDHGKDIDEFKKEAESGSDPDIKSFAIRTLPVFQIHLDSAKSIKAALK